MLALFALVTFGGAFGGGVGSGDAVVTLLVARGGDNISGGARGTVGRESDDIIVLEERSDDLDRGRRERE